MENEALAGALNALADKLNEAAAALDAVSHVMPDIAPGSPLARMVEQGEQFAKIMPNPGEPTKWESEFLRNGPDLRKQ
jgi:hypothetical protein